jgi:hypothetical protein
MSTITLPSELNAPNALALASSLIRHDAESDMVVDFSALRSAEPFGLLVTGAALRAVSRARNYRQTNATGVRAGDPAHEYFGNIGFFQWIGIRVGESPGVVAGGATWLPVTTITRAELDRRIGETGKPLGSVVHQECDRFAKLLTQSNQTKVNVPIAYCLREVIRNVFEHADTDRCVVCAQRTSDGNIELAVIDQGRGIRRSLAERLTLASDEEALRAAIQAGVSRSPSDDPDNPWGNSGFGLFVLSELGRELGVFRVVSGQAGLHLTDGESRTEGASFDGTAIQLRLRRRPGTSLVDFIESVITRGESVPGGKLRPRASQSTRKIR